MKFTVNTLHMRLAMNATYGLASKRSNGNRPILTTVKIFANETLSITGTDLEQKVSFKVDSAEIETPGQICVPAKLLHNYLKAVETETVTLEYLEDKTKLRLSSGLSRLHMNVMDPNDYPSDPNIELNFFNIDGDKFISSLLKLQPFMSKDETRIYLNSVLLAPGEMAATDGHRMGVITDPAFELSDKELIIPSGAVNSITKLFVNAENIRLAVGDSMIYVQAGDILFSTRLISRDYPKYRAVIPTEGEPRLVRGVKTHLINASKRLLLLLDNSRNKGVKMEFTTDNVVVTASDQSAGEGSELIEATGFEDGTIVGFNGNYLKEGLESLEEDTFEFQVRGPLNPIVFKEGSYTHVIMPIKL